MNYRAVETTDEYVARLETGSDWRAEIESLADAVDADAAWFTALGAVQDAELWFLRSVGVRVRPDRVRRAARGRQLRRERLPARGRTLRAHPRGPSDDEGTAYAGHLNEATVWAGEVHMRVFAEPLEREYDDTTELDLWL